MKYLIIFFCFIPFLSLGQNSLMVEIQGVKSSDGKINVAIYNKAEGFLKFENVFLSDSTKASQGKTELLIKDLPNGEYALAVFHDENSNDELDTNWLGIPREPIGFSKGHMKTFGPPTFRECAFKITSNKAIKISL